MEETHTDLVVSQLVVVEVVPVLPVVTVHLRVVVMVVMDHLMFMHMDQHNL
jgi:hypothetical protein